MIKCPYCNIPAIRATGENIYPHRKDLYHKRFYLCPQCGAYVGCHPGTWKELGRLADSELRTAKSNAHAVFDRLWRDGAKMSRREAYAWLSKSMGIPSTETHIGMFDVEQCKLVVELVNARRQDVTA